MRLNSLRARLLLTVSVTTLLVWGISGVSSYYQAIHEVDELMDGQLAQSAKMLLAQVQLERPDAEQVISQGMLGKANHPYEQHLEYRVMDADGRPLLRSTNAPAAISVVRTDNSPVYSNVEHHGQLWRLLRVYSPDGHIQVQIAHPTQDRERAGLEVAAQVAIPILLALPLLALLVYFSVRSSLRPLEDLAADVAARSPDNLQVLSEPLTLRETLPLVAALNRLLSRLAATLDNERRFTADAAHELRTPLAAVKIQAQVALASTDTANHQHALRQVLAGVDRSTRLVEQLLRLARLDPLSRLPQTYPVDLVRLATQIVADLQMPAANKQQRLFFVAPGTPCEVEGDADLLGVALRNLVENALRYTPENGLIEVFVQSEEAAREIGVCDSGPGVHADEEARLVERFYRGRAAGNAENSDGSGLGLAIAQRIAELHGARLEIENRSVGGLEARLRWS
jgi:two-component system, OmpR family, sensor histidine kinase QseC